MLLWAHVATSGSGPSAVVTTGEEIQGPHGLIAHIWLTILELVKEGRKMGLYNHGGRLIPVEGLSVALSTDVFLTRKP